MGKASTGGRARARLRSFAALAAFAAITLAAGYVLGRNRWRAPHLRLAPTSEAGEWPEEPPPDVDSESETG